MGVNEAQQREGKDIPWWMLTAVIAIIVGLAILIFLMRGVTIEGTVKDALKGTPVGGATITMGIYSTTSDENGSFKLKAPKLEGEIVVNAPGYEPLSTTAERSLFLSLVPLPEKVASYWFNYWREANYREMYNLLTSECRNATSGEAFEEEFSRYKLEIVDVRTEKMEAKADTATVLAEVDINTPLGKQTLRFSLQFRKEGGLWKAVWYGAGATPAQPPS